MKIIDSGIKIIRLWRVLVFFQFSSIAQAEGFIFLSGVQYQKKTGYRGLKVVLAPFLLGIGLLDPQPENAVVALVVETIFECVAVLGACWLILETLQK